MTAAARPPAWYELAHGYLGTKEYTPQAPGPGGEQSNPVIERWQKLAGIRRPDDEIPWCAAFVTGVLHESGLTDFATSAARVFARYGDALSEPRYGCIVALWRDSPTSPHGHVGFYAREDAQNVWLLGGNQANAVVIRPYAKGRVLHQGYRWPTPATLERAGLTRDGIRRAA